MMTCKDVSTLVSMGDVERAPMARRMAVWLHLAMCRHCRAFRRQMALMGRAARLVSEAFGREPSPRFEGTILEHLGS
jgi:predicted anti-sigma-YlaC factor YlaD